MRVWWETHDQAGQCRAVVLRCVRHQAHPQAICHTSPAAAQARPQAPSAATAHGGAASLTPHAARPLAPTTTPMPWHAPHVGAAASHAPTQPHPPNQHAPPRIQPAAASTGDTAAPRSPTQGAAVQAHDQGVAAATTSHPTPQPPQPGHHEHTPWSANHREYRPCHRGCSRGAPCDGSGCRYIPSSFGGVPPPPPPQGPGARGRARWRFAAWSGRPAAACTTPGDAGGGVRSGSAHPPRLGDGCVAGFWEAARGRRPA